MASSSTTIASETIWPTGLDVAAVAGEGKYLYEKKLAQAFKAFAQNFRVSGLAIPGSSANLNITIALGEAVISGFYCEVPATQVTAFASVTNHVFLKLTRDGSNKVTGAQYEVNDTGTAPADSLKIGTLTANGAAITATTHSGRTGRDFRRMPLVQGFTANGNFTVPDDVSEVYVECLGAGGGAGGTGGIGFIGGGPASLGGQGGDGGAGGFGADTVAVSPGAIIPVTVGAGAGQGGAGSDANSGTAAGGDGSSGGTGGASSFGALVSANGGAGGAGGQGGQTGFPGENGRNGNTGAPGTSSATANLDGGGAPGGIGSTSGKNGRVVVYY